MQRHEYDDEELRALAAASTCMTEMLERLGVQVTPGRRRHLWYRLNKANADLSHWDRSRRSYSRERLAEAVAASVSYAGVLRHLGVPQAGGSQAYLARRIRRDGLDTSHFTGQAHMRGTVGSRRLRPEEVLVVRPAGSARVGTPSSGAPWSSPECRTSAAIAAWVLSGRDSR